MGVTDFVIIFIVYVVAACMMIIDSTIQTIQEKKGVQWLSEYWFELTLHLTIRFYSLRWIKVGHLPISGQG